ncbi:hypothetical protein IGI04_038573 [Brassica rapa subsp. trilocularis]|uniref:2-C-methyl-D-erythritol 4-phosphate cytidylyltransferase n=1 Tax=Brassica rapa subsp. trilocularis TaxID=1813537 RepID=A0ABQ7LNE3_BRACM|nr:hypothetical protein IGI04_038573 [Brassica rapa subsp. trilocularis]
MFLVHDGCRHGKLLEMTQEDYDLDNKIAKIANTPLMPVTNNRQVRNLIELSKTHFVRLCVSSMRQIH